MKNYSFTLAVFAAVSNAIKLQQSIDPVTDTAAIQPFLYDSAQGDLDMVSYGDAMNMIVDAPVAQESCCGIDGCDCDLCIDENNDGYCDIAGCVDADNDGVCDTCGTCTTCSTCSSCSTCCDCTPCVDYDNDGHCDPCLDFVGDGNCINCVDADKDGVCDGCVDAN